MERFRQKSKKAPSQMFDWVLNMPMNSLYYGTNFAQIFGDLGMSYPFRVLINEVKQLLDWIHNTISFWRPNKRLTSRPSAMYK